MSNKIQFAWRFLDELTLPEMATNIVVKTSKKLKIMIVVLSILVISAIILKFFPPKKPNYLFGYQLGSAKKSSEHWKIANRYASNYMIVVYGLILGLALIFANQKYDGEPLLLGLMVVGLIVIYFSIENKLKKID